jgi:hypothetical protein
MKKIITVFAIALLGMTVFGQRFIRDHSFIESTPTANNTVEDAINRKNFNFENFDWISCVHFVEDGRLYLLSYEPVPDINEMDMDRNIYLYSKDINNNDSPWELASDTVLERKFVDMKNYTDVDFYFYDENKHNTSVGMVNAVDDVREIIIGEYSKQKGRIFPDRKLKIVFTPISTNFYSIEKCYL